MLTRSLIVGALALLLPAITSAQIPPAPAATRPSPVVGIPGVVDATKATREAPLTGVAGQRLVHYSCGADAQLGYPTASGFTANQVSGAGTVGAGNAETPAFSRITKVAGKSGLGIEYVSTSNGVGVPGPGASYIYRFDRGGFHRIQCDLPWTGSTLPIQDDGPIGESHAREGGEVAKSESLNQGNNLKACPTSQLKPPAGGQAPPTRRPGIPVSTSVECQKQGG